MGKSVALLEAIPHQAEADSFDFGRSWMGIKSACKGRAGLIFGVCALTIALTVAYIRIWPPIYVATVALVGESDRDRSRENFYQNWAVFRNDQLTDEVHMITAAPVLGEVINRMGLTNDTVYHTFLAHIGYLWTTSSIGKQYRAAKDWLFPPVRGPYDPSPEQAEAAATLQNFRNGVQLDRVMETNLGNLVVRGPNPRVAEIANTIISVYFEQRRQRHVDEANTAYDALSIELEKARVEVVGIEDAMRRYYSDNSLLLTFEKDKIDIGQSQALKASIVELQTAISTNEKTLEQIDAELGRESRDVVSSRVMVVNPLQDSLKGKLSDLQVARKQALLHFRPDSPDVADLDRRIAILVEQLGRQPNQTLQQTTTVLSPRYEELRGRGAQIRSELAGQRAGLESRLAAFQTSQTMLATIPEKMRVVHDMERDHQAAEKKFSVIQEKMMIAAVSRATAQSASESIRVVEAASPPGDPSWPKSKLLLAAAAAVGLVAGVLSALLLDLFFGRVHRFRLTSISQDLPVYALVQRDRTFATGLFSPPAPRGRPRLLGSE